MTTQHLYLPGYTLREAEALAGLAYNTIQKQIQKGNIRAEKNIFGQHRIPYAELVRFIESRKD